MNRRAHCRSDGIFYTNEMTFYQNPHARPFQSIAVQTIALDAEQFANLFFATNETLAKQR